MGYHGGEDEDSQDSHLFLQEGSTVDGQPSRRKSQWTTSILWILMIANIFSLPILFTLWSSTVPPPTNLRYESLTHDNKSYPSGPLSWSQNFKALPCGQTPEEARARGCEFDMLVTAWLPSRCIDRELVREFMSLGKWQFYDKQDGNENDKLITYDPAFLGSINQTIWTTRRWHTTHCVFMFKKLDRALVHGWSVDAEAISEPHMDHCMNTLIDQVLFGPSLDPDEVNTYLEIIYPPC